jgi:hypothetical protein
MSIVFLDSFDLFTPPITEMWVQPKEVEAPLQIILYVTPDEWHDVNVVWEGEDLVVSLNGGLDHHFKTETPGYFKSVYDHIPAISFRMPSTSDHTHVMAFNGVFKITALPLEGQSEVVVSNQTSAPVQLCQWHVDYARQKQTLDRRHLDESGRDLLAQLRSRLASQCQSLVPSSLLAHFSETK